MEKLTKKQAAQLKMISQPRTVNKEVHDAWLLLKTFGDVKKIQEIIKAEALRTGEKIPSSQPTVTLAINQGFCFKPRLEEIITAYFNNKLKELTPPQKTLVEGVAELQEA